MAGGAAERGAGAPGGQRVVQKQHQLVLRGAVRHRQVVLLIITVPVHHEITELMNTLRHCAKWCMCMVSVTVVLQDLHCAGVEPRARGVAAAAAAAGRPPPPQPRLRLDRHRARAPAAGRGQL